MLGVECDPSKIAGDQHKYVRFEGLPDSRRLDEYDHGRVTIATSDIPSNLRSDAIGEIWISYTVKLSRPRVVVSLGRTIQQDVYVNMDTDQQVFCGAGRGLGDHPTAKTTLWSDNKLKLYSHKCNSLGTQISWQQGTGNSGVIGASRLSPNSASSNSSWKLISGPLQNDAQDAAGSVATRLARRGYFEIMFPANLSGDYAIKLQGVTTYRMDSSASTPTVQDIHDNMYGTLTMLTNTGSGILPLCDIPTGHDDRGKSMTQAEVASSTPYQDFRCSSITCAVKSVSKNEISSNIDNQNMTITSHGDHYIGFVLEARVSIQPAVGGVDNLLALGFVLLDSAGTQVAHNAGMSCTVRQHNSLFDDMKPFEAFQNEAGDNLPVRSLVNGVGT
jgi:hypothetical protein